MHPLTSTPSPPPPHPLLLPHPGLGCNSTAGKFGDTCTTSAAPSVDEVKEAEAKAEPACEVRAGWCLPLARACHWLVRAAGWCLSCPWGV